MDKRHTEIVAGAGLEESRINTDLVDFLKRWGSPILITVLVLALGYRGFIFLETRKIQRLDSAYLEFEAASVAGQPVALVQVAEDWRSVPVVSALARLHAADRYILAFTAELKPGGVAGAAEDRPSENERAGYLDQAERLYRAVADELRTKPEHAYLHLHALSGVSSVQASRGEFEAAISSLRDAISRARDAKLSGLAEAYEARLERLETRPNVVAFARFDDLPKLLDTTPADDEGFMTPEEFLRQGAGEVGPPMPPIEPEPDPAPPAENAPTTPPAEPTTTPPGVE